MDYFSISMNFPLASQDLDRVLENKAQGVVERFLREAESLEEEKLRERFHLMVGECLGSGTAPDLLQPLAATIAQIARTKLDVLFKRLRNAELLSEIVVPKEKDADLDALLAKKIGSIGLSVRAMNALEGDDIYTVRDLVLKYPGDLRMIRNLGEGCLMEVLRKLAEFHLGCGYKSVEEIKSLRKDGEKSDDASIDDFLEPLSAHAQKALCSLRLRTFKDARSLTLDKLKAVPGCGPQTVFELVEKFAKVNVFLMAESQ